MAKLGILQVDGSDYDPDGVYDTVITDAQYQYAETLDAQYRDIGEDLAEWCKHGKFLLQGWDRYDEKENVFHSFADYPTGFKDWRALRQEIKNRLLSKAGNDLSTWDTLTSDEKYSAVRYCYSHIKKTDETKLSDGVPNPLELAQLRSEFDVNNTHSRQKRHVAVRGAILDNTLDIADALDSLEYVQNNGMLPAYIGGKEGTPSGDNEGYLDWLMSLGTYAGLEINAVDIATKKITLTGDQQDKINSCSHFCIKGSTGNDKKYTFNSVTLASGNTEIIVNETLDSSIADGEVHYNGFLQYAYVSKPLRDIIVNIYRFGAY